MSTSRETVSNLSDTLDTLAAMHEFEWTVEYSEEAESFGVIATFSGETDIIGSGDVESEALADAIATVRGWESAS